MISSRVHATWPNKSVLDLSCGFSAEQNNTKPMCVCSWCVLGVLGNIHEVHIDLNLNSRETYMIS